MAAQGGRGHQRGHRLSWLIERAPCGLHQLRHGARDVQVLGLHPQLPLEDRLDAAPLVGDLHRLLIGAPLALAQHRLGLGFCRHLRRLQRPRAGQQRPVLVTQGLRVEVSGGHPPEHLDGLPDHRQQGHGAGDEAPADLWRDDPIQFALQRLPVAAALIERHGGGRLQAQLREAAPVGALIDRGVDRTEQEHRARAEPLCFASGGALADEVVGIGAGAASQIQDRLDPQGVGVVVRLRLVEDHRQGIAAQRLTDAGLGGVALHTQPDVGEQGVEESAEQL